jgi:hypothetical protein
MPKRGWRVIDGVRWAWFCSVICSAADARAHMSPENRHRGHQAWRADCFRIRFEALIQELRHEMDADRRVAVDVLARFIVNRERDAYRRGAESMRQRLRRTA